MWNNQSQLGQTKESSNCKICNESFKCESFGNPHECKQCKSCDRNLKCKICDTKFGKDIPQSSQVEEKSFKF
jgi:hypothetical protein